MSPPISNLLLVDDDSVFRDRLALSFQRRGYTVETAKDVAEGWSKASLAPPEAAIIDLKMPGEPGLVLVEKIRKAWPKTRIIVLTGYGSIATAVDAMRLGADDYVTKPTDTDHLEQVLLKTPATPRKEDVVVDTPSLDRVEWEHLQRVLHDCDGNISKTARLLGIDRRSLQRKLQKYPPQR
jgi:two-component system response regulator RegA